MSASSAPAMGTVVTGAGTKDSTTYLPLWSSAQALAGNGGGIAVDVAGVVGIADGTAPWLQPITTNAAVIPMQIRLHHGRNARRFGGLLILPHCCGCSRQATESRVPFVVTECPRPALGWLQRQRPSCRWWSVDRAEQIPPGDHADNFAPVDDREAANPFLEHDLHGVGHVRARRQRLDGT